MNRPLDTHFHTLSYREFCESYEVCSRGPTPTQRLERWQLANQAGFIKARTQKQVVRPSPNYRTDETNADYCYSQLFMYKPWRKLSEFPMDDDGILEAYVKWKRSGDTRWTTLIDNQVVRTDILDHAQSANLSRVNLPGPDWSIELPAVVTNDRPVMATAATERIHFSSRFAYTNDDVARARAFAKDVLKPFVKTMNSQPISNHCGLPYVYPTDDQEPRLTEDQWKPFARWMKQTRQRVSAAAVNEPCEQLVMIVQGEGGTGKSWLIHQIIQDLRLVVGYTEYKKRVLLMSHQGSAAYLIGGRTISSTLALPGHHGSSFRTPYIPLASTQSGQTSLRRLQNEYEFVTLLIIDEFGVISCGMLNWIDERLREVFPSHASEPFGGRDVLFTGDPGQLGPVTPSPLATPVDQLYLPSEKRGRQLWESINTFYLLHQQNRGESDPEWYEMLKRVRNGQAEESDVILINSRVGKPPSSCRNPTYLAFRNVDVDDANDMALATLARPTCQIPATHKAAAGSRTQIGDLDDDTKRSLIEEAKEMTSAATKCIPLVLKLAIDVPVVLTYNLEQRAGLCNGSNGTVYDIIPDDQTDNHMPIVLVRMKDYKGPSFVQGVAGIVPITSKTMVLSNSKDRMYKLSRTGLPLRLGFATTIHKIQGRTCDNVVFNPAHLRNCALAYVALSRVRSRVNMFITSSISSSQLKKTERARKLDDDENARVDKIVQATATATPHVVADMKIIAHMHNVAVNQG